jgi:arylformamidase
MNKAIVSGNIDRRLLISSLAVGIVALPSHGSAQQVAAPADNKAKVWLDMDQHELDDAYDQSKYAPNFQQVLKRYASNSHVTRSRIGDPRRESYGPTAIEKLEIYSPKASNAPIHIHIHGGAWRQRPATEYAFPAEMFTRAGAHYVVPDFVSVDETNGDLTPMVDQVRRAIAWTVQNATRFGGDPSRVFLSGFSSGSHLAGVALLTEWKTDCGLPDDIIKGAVLSSGLYDLKAVRLSARSKYVAFTDDIEQKFSTQRHIAKIRTPLVLAHGSYETPEFKRQTRDFAKAVEDAGKPCRFFINENYNHFEMMETFGNPYGLLGRAILTQMELPG